MSFTLRQALAHLGFQPCVVCMNLHAKNTPPCRTRGRTCLLKPLATALYILPGWNVHPPCPPSHRVCTVASSSLYIPSSLASSLHRMCWPQGPPSLFYSSVTCSLASPLGQGCRLQVRGAMPRSMRPGNSQAGWLAGSPSPHARTVHAAAGFLFLGPPGGWAGSRSRPGPAKARSFAVGSSLQPTSTIAPTRRTRRGGRRRRAAPPHPSRSG